MILCASLPKHERERRYTSLSNMSWQRPLSRIQAVRWQFHLVVPIPVGWECGFALTSTAAYLAGGGRWRKPSASSSVGGWVVPPVVRGRWRKPPASWVVGTALRFRARGHSLVVFLGRWRMPHVARRYGPTESSWFLCQPRPVGYEIIILDRSKVITLFHKCHGQVLIIGRVVVYRLCRGSLAFCVRGRWLSPPASRVACLPVLTRLVSAVLIHFVARSARACSLNFVWPIFPGSGRIRAVTALPAVGGATRADKSAVRSSCVAFPAAGG